MISNFMCYYKKKTSMGKVAHSFADCRRPLP